MSENNTENVDNRGKEIEKAIISELKNRRGFDHWWESIDTDIQAEIRTSLADSVRSVYTDQPTPEPYHDLDVCQVCGELGVISNIPHQRFTHLPVDERAVAVCFDASTPAVVVHGERFLQTAPGRKLRSNNTDTDTDENTTAKAIERLSDTMDDLDRAHENAPEITEDRRSPEDDHLNAAIADAHMKIEEAIEMLEGERDPRQENK